MIQFLSFSAVILQNMTADKGAKRSMQQSHQNEEKIFMEMECDYLYGWIKNGHVLKKSYPKLVNPRDIAGNTCKEEEKMCAF